jgi:hypothetical protein
MANLALLNDCPYYCLLVGSNGAASASPGIVARGLREKAL